MSAAATLAKMFGGKKGEPPSPQIAIQKLRETEDMLNKKSEYFEKQIEDQTKLVKKYGIKNKKGEVAVCMVQPSLQAIDYSSFHSLPLSHIMQLL